ncbi:WXG100 family type VII secretion target [Streptomyces albipurpureus]|uniref:PPE family domain-containing protein n=1 Tax=Streptomyces albipurpureus TaxID=2897419 RepID=A0ABT0UWF6_9ACTN|nr:hypothetical protein [Streptomyces sp. CWNU-1]MCM2392274.1 hypothetical protein [Streptomyces sp. CWNU-1]
MGAESTPGGGGFFSPLRILGSLFGTTDFEAHTHEQLLAMVEAANPKTLETLSAQLTDAAKTITQIGEDLKTYITGVPWEGEAGKAMEAWGEGAWKATLQLGTYSNVGGTWMGHAAQTLREVKQNMPPVDATAKGNIEAAHKFRNMPDYKELLGPAQAKVREDHAQAVQQMNKLAQSYSFSTFVIGAAEAPTFPPPPGQFVPDDQRKSRRVYRDGAEQNSRTINTGTENPRRSAQSSYAETAAKPDSTSFVPPQNATETVRPSGPPGSQPTGQPVGMEIDSVDTLAPTTTTQSQTPGSGFVPTKPEGASTVLPGAIPPTFTRNPGGPGVVGAGSGSATAKGVSGGRGALPAGQIGSVGGIGQVGASGMTGSRMPIPREGGIVGGKPVMPTTSNPTGAIPRGTVIGTEGTTGARGGAMGRGMAGMPGGMYGGGPMGGADQSGVSGGRRLASETGGVVGGRQPQSGQSSARPFTPGGSGLIRGAGDQSPSGRAGAGAVGANRAGSRHEDESGERPDYLSEDEETWQQGNRRVVPPVID